MRKSEYGQSASAIIDLSALELPLIAINTKQIASRECQCKTKWFYGSCGDRLTKEMVNVDRCKSIRVSVMVTDYAVTIDMLQIAFDAYATVVENELKLPKSETNVLKRFANEKLQI